MERSLMLQTVTVENVENIAVLTMANNVTNQLSPEMVMEMSSVVNEMKNEAMGLVLCGGEKFFSMGLALPPLLGFKRAAMANFWNHFNQLLFDIYTLPIPTFSVMEGHAVAGGNIVALTSDYRFGADAPKKIGLNEITLGLPVPFLAEMLLKQIVGERVAMHMMYSGAFLSFPEAKECGLIDELHEKELLKEKAMEKVMELAQLEPKAFAIMKENRTQLIAQSYQEKHVAQNEAFLDCWFSEPVQKILHKAAEKF